MSERAPTQTTWICARWLRACNSIRNGNQHITYLPLIIRKVKDVCWKHWFEHTYDPWYEQPWHWDESVYAMASWLVSRICVVEEIVRVFDIVDVTDSISFVNWRDVINSRRDFREIQRIQYIHVLIVNKKIDFSGDFCWIVWRVSAELQEIQ